MMSALPTSAVRSAMLQSSTVTNNTVESGAARARRAARLRPETPPAQPSPNTGIRWTSLRKSIFAMARASRLGVAMPVEDTVTIVSMSPRRQARFGKGAFSRRHKQVQRDLKIDGRSFR